MQKKNVNAVFLALMACPVFLLGFWVNQSFALSVADYYPLDQGRWWQYDVTETYPNTGNVDHSVQIQRIDGVEDVDYSGTIYQGVKFYEAGMHPSANTGDSDYKVIGSVPEGFQTIKYVNNTTGEYDLYGSSGSVGPTGPVLNIPAVMNIGEPFITTYETYLYDSGNNQFGQYGSTETLTLDGFENVTVPAGSFDQSAKVTDVGTGDSDLFSTTNELFLAKGVGVVKNTLTFEKDDSTHVAELLRYGTIGSVELFNFDGEGVPSGITQEGDGGTLTDENGKLHLFSPDGAPIGFGLYDAPADDFEIAFRYSMLGDGFLKFYLDGNSDPYKSIAFNSSNVDDAFFYDEIFNMEDLGLIPGTEHHFSFLLTGPADPEFYLADLAIRNLGESHPSVDAVPEPATILLLGAGVAGAFWRKRRK